MGGKWVHRMSMTSKGPVCANCGPVEERWNTREKDRLICPIKKREQKRRYKYKMTLLQYESLSKVCNLCESQPATSVDHDHACCPGRITCGKCIRGHLCVDCNLGLGRFKDSPELLRKAITYLETE